MEKDAQFDETELVGLAVGAEVATFRAGTLTDTISRLTDTRPEQYSFS